MKRKLIARIAITLTAVLVTGALAAADNIEGPYTVLTDEKPLAYGNDAHLFVDDDGKTYLFSSGICGAGIARSKSPLEGWEVDPEPIYGGINENSCINYGGIYETGVYEYQDKYREAGHNCVFTGPDGEKWIAAHAYDYTDGEVKLVIDRLVIDDEGVRVIDIDPETGEEKEIKGPTWGKRSVKKKS